MFSVSSLRNRLSPALQESFDRMKGSILEALAHRMPPEDAEIMIKHWESLIPGRKSIEQHSSPTANNNHNSIEDFSHTELDKKIEETDKNITTWAVPQNSKDICLLHPVFGKLLVDLGYKRTYLTNAISLARAPIWEKQRILRHERATRIAQTKIDSKRPNLMVGTITMFNDLQGKYGIIDGQHRAAAYLIMAQRGFIDQMERNIVVDVIETNSNEDISSIFKEINSAEPVRLIDMPDEVSDLS